MQKLLTAGLISFGLIVACTAAEGRNRRVAQASESTQMCHLWYRDMRSGHIMDDREIHPFERLGALEAAVKANDRRYRGRKYGVMCERVITSSLCQVVRFEPKGGGMIAGYGEARPASQRAALEATAASLNGRRRGHYRVEYEHSGVE